MINPKSHQKAAAILYNIYWHDWFYTQANEFQIFFFKGTFVIFLWLSFL